MEQSKNTDYCLVIERKIFKTTYNNKENYITQNNIQLGPSATSTSPY